MWGNEIRYNIYIYTAHIITHIYSNYSDIELTHMAKACLDPCYLIRLDRLMQWAIPSQMWAPIVSRNPTIDALFPRILKLEEDTEVGMLRHVETPSPRKKMIQLTQYVVSAKYECRWRDFTIGPQTFSSHNSESHLMSFASSPLKWYMQLHPSSWPDFINFHTQTVNTCVYIY